MALLYVTICDVSRKSLLFVTKNLIFCHKRVIISLKKGEIIINFLSSNIKYLRQSNNLTQEELANIVGKTRSLISQWESDDRDISTEDIIKLSNHFGVPMNKLIELDLRENNQNHIAGVDLLFDKYKDKLTEGDIELIKTIIEQRKKEIDRELDGE